VDHVEGDLLNAYMGLNMLDEADALHQKFVNEHPDHAWTLGNYAAFLCDQKKDYDKAIEYAQKALAIMDYGVGRYTLARAAALKAHQLIQQNQLEEAEPYFIMALEKKPNFKEAWAGLAVVNYSLGKQNNDLERMRHAQKAATNATRLGMNDQNWAMFMVQIVTDLTEMEKQAKQKPETKD
jgi:Tfp pilus assembly protein PilF